MNIPKLAYYTGFFLLAAIQWQCTESSGEEQKTAVRPASENPVPQFNTLRAEPGNITHQVTITGRVAPIQKIDVVAQVPGIVESQAKAFEEGVTFRRGEVLISLDDDEFRHNLSAQKSQFMASLARIMSDLKLDYPAAFGTWNEYLKTLDIDKPLPELPEIQDEQHRYFFTANNILNLYYTIKSQEETLEKYVIRAPFTGAVTQATMDAGGLVSPGVKLGEFIRTDQYEVQAAVSLEDISLVAPGQTIELTAKNLPGSWEGQVNRVGKRVDPTTQSVAVYLRVAGDDLKEGMYLEGKIAARTYDDAVAVPLDVLTRKNQLYIINDSTVHLKSVTPLEYQEATVIVQGLALGDRVITDAIESPIQGITAVSK